MGLDEAGTLAALKACLREIVTPKITEHHGRIVRTTGDGVLVEFASAVDAVRCALEIQQRMASVNLPEDRRIDFRVGINVGDIVIDEGDIFGDGVNVAARLESITDRGGVCISRQVLDQIEGKIPLSCRELGRQNLKNIARPVEVYAINLNDAAPPGASVLAAANLHQTIRYCTASDGVRLAYATVGSGPPLMKSLKLAQDHTLVRYDARGNGLSDWDVSGLSLDAWVSDMEAVADAAGLGRFPLSAFRRAVPYR